MSKQTHVLVTGAGGFIGHHLVKFLKEKGYWVRGVDIKNPEYEPSKADEFALLDLRRWENCQKAMEGIEEVYALAADMGGMGFISANHSKILHNNSLINIHTLEAAREAGVRRYLYTSSACIYPVGKQSEEMSHTLLNLAGRGGRASCPFRDGIAADIDRATPLEKIDPEPISTLACSPALAEKAHATRSVARTAGRAVVSAASSPWFLIRRKRSAARSRAQTEPPPPHVAVAPALDVPGHVAQRPNQVLDAVRRREEAPQAWGQVEL
jgi:nucleoside-diphosphate-sugar epimerase